MTGHQHEEPGQQVSPQLRKPRGAQTTHQDGEGHHGGLQASRAGQTDEDPGQPWTATGPGQHRRGGQGDRDHGEVDETGQVDRWTQHHPEDVPGTASDLGGTALFIDGKVGVRAAPQQHNRDDDGQESHEKHDLGDSPIGVGCVENLLVSGLRGDFRTEDPHHTATEGHENSHERGLGDVGVREE